MAEPYHTYDANVFLSVCVANGSSDAYFQVFKM